jgi:hypothetical protein
MDITKVFDIQGSPKTAEKLESLRKSCTKRIKITYWILEGFLCFLMIYFLSFILYPPRIFTLICAITTAILMFIINKGTINDLRNLLKLLQPITPNSPEFIAWHEKFGGNNKPDEVFSDYLSDFTNYCKNYPVIAAYIDKVVQQGRPLVEGELQTINKWIVEEEWERYNRVRKIVKNNK